MNNKDNFEKEDKLVQDDDVKQDDKIILETELEESGEELKSEEVNELELQIYELELQMQELLVNIEKIENQYSPDNFYELDSNEEYINLKNEYKELNSQKKALIKELRSQNRSKFDDISVWVIIYGIIMFVISLPFITATLWMDFSQWLIEVFSESFANLNTDGILYEIIIFLVLFSLPLLLNIITWLVHNNFIKTKTNRKVFVGFWIAQGLMSLGMIIYMCVLLYGA